MAKSLDEVLWELLGQECRLNEQHIRMAKRLGVVPEHLAECGHEQLKLHLKTWIEKAYVKTFDDDHAVHSSPTPSYLNNSSRD